jgi:hypothetical protein
MTSNLCPEHGAEVAAEEEAEVADLRASPKNSSVTSTGLTLIIEQTLEKTLERMESEKKAKLVGHTTWPQTPQTQPQQI